MRFAHLPTPLEGMPRLSAHLGGRVAGHPWVLFDFPMLPILGGNRPYDIGPDGRFLVIRNGQAEAAGGTAPQIVLVQNWFEELKRLMPVK